MSTSIDVLYIRFYIRWLNNICNENKSLILYQVVS